jgi:transcriptional regulator with XRE-family HTH domain
MMLAKILDDEMSKRRLSVREAGKVIGVSHTTIARILAGEPADVSTLQKVCDWLGISLASALNSEGVGDDALAANIAVLLQREPKLAAVFSSMIEQVKEGNLNPNDVRDIVEYANFKIAKRKEAQLTD